MQATNYSRKLDASGRLVIPTRLREQLGLEVGREYEFYIWEEDGRKFVGIECPPVSQMTLEEARRIVAKYGT